MRNESPVLVGIDLGTTFSLVATMIDGAPRVLPNALGEILTPSAVHVDASGSVLVGAAARARAITDPARTALAFKRDMGTDRRFDLSGRSFGATELSALVLRGIKHDAEEHLGAEIAEAVVTVPAYFGELQRRATREACTLASLNVERIINEPTAAAMAYGLHSRSRELRAIVLDLGGGTFDVTVLEIMEGVIEIQASAGDARLGGEDFVDQLLEHVNQRSLSGCLASLPPRAQARLREACETVKCRLSVQPSAAIVLPAFPYGSADRASLENLELNITSDEAEQLWEPLLERIRSPIRRALRDAGIGPERIDEVLLVGGATRMPCVARLAAQVFGRLPLRTLPPDEAVALGAAVQAALKGGHDAVSDMVVTDIAPFSLGVAISEKIGGGSVAGLFSPILERGTVLPASRVRRFHTLQDGQRTIRVEVYQGEHSLCRDNVKIGEYEVNGVPPRPAGEESIDVRFTYDLNGVLDVDTTVISKNVTSTLTIERDPGHLTPAEFAETRRRLQALKFHPREALPNITALARADALYVEVTGAEREALGQAISVFRATLEAQNPDSIRVQRETLLDIVTRLRSGPVA